MPYRLKLDESVPEEIRRITIEQAESAAEELSSCRRSTRDTAIHEARKSVKRIRCMLRLVRRDLGSRYKTERRNLRIVAHRLSEFRDAGAVIGAFDKLREEFPDDFRRPTLDRLRVHLIAHKQETEKAAHIDQVVRKMAARLRAVASGAKTWRLESDGFQAIAAGLEQTLRRGRKTMSRARMHERPEGYHQWRKYVKEQRYHMRLVEDLWTGVMPGYKNMLKQIDTWLDDDHNLSLLRKTILARPCCHANEEDTALILSRINQRQSELRANSLSLAKRVYEERAGVFRRRMKHLWSAWRTGTKPGTHRTGSRNRIQALPIQIQTRCTRLTGSACAVHRSTHAGASKRAMLTSET